MFYYFNSQNKRDLGQDQENYEGIKLTCILLNTFKCIELTNICYYFNTQELQRVLL